jgi:hypothetical protein
LVELPDAWQGAASSDSGAINGLEGLAVGGGAL